MTDRHGEQAMAGIAGHGSGWQRNRWRIAAWSFASLILLLPLIAMQFTDTVNWSVGDFVFAGVLVIGTGIAYELAMRMTRSIAYRAAAGIALAGAFLLLWLNGAVGVIGDEDNPANLMYGGVLAIGFLGAILARFQAHGMARTLFVMAIAQALIGVIALVGGLGYGGPTWPWDVVGLTGFFVVLFAGSGLLFRNAARE